MSKSVNRAILSYLVNLMMHIIKWHTEPEKRSRSWGNTIDNGRKQIDYLQNDKPSLTDEFLKANWDDCTKKAIKDAEKEMKTEATKTSLTWEEVFTKPYIITLLIVMLLIGGIIYFHKSAQKLDYKPVEISANS